MAQYTLTKAQRDVMEPFIDKTVDEQNAVATYRANKTAGEARRDTCHSKLRAKLVEDGYTTGLPGTITALTKDLEPDDSWAGKITVT